MRPAKKQFNIWWDKYSRQQYEPDFVVETADCIYMAEIKMSGEIESEVVQLKAQAGKNTVLQRQSLMLSMGVNHGNICLFLMMSLKRVSFLTGWPSSLKCNFAFQPEVIINSYLYWDDYYVLE